MAEKSFGRAEQIRATHARLDERLPGRVPERPGVCACVRRFPPARPIGARLAPPRRRSPLLGDIASAALSLHTGCARNNFPDSLFSLISCEIQYPKFSTTGVWKRDLSLSLSLRYPSSALFPFALRSKLRPIQNCAEARPRNAKRERYRCFPMGR